MALLGPTSVFAETHVEPEDEETEYFFLKDLPYGTEAAFGPLNVLLNSGFDILRSGSYQNRLGRIDFRGGAENIIDNSLHPNTNVELSGGWADFVAHEVFPYKAFDPDHGHFVPNYFLHVVGEGLLFRKLEEWYDRENYPAPTLSALATIFATQFLNEAVENGSYRGANNDPIADILIFNPLGWLLFSSDSVARFFSTTLKTGFWPGQPSLDLRTMSLYNAGESYYFKVGLNEDESVSFFNYMGAEGLTGLSFRYLEEDHLTVAAGYRVVWMNATVDEDHRSIVPEQPGNWVASFFWDRNDSLLFSIKVGITAEPTLRMNLYPGVVEFAGGELGAFLWTSPGEGVIAGVSFSVSPLGLAVQGGGDLSRQIL